MMKQYEVFEIVLSGKPPKGSEALAEVIAVFGCNGKEWKVRGFYDGNGVYKVRFLPKECGLYQWKITGAVEGEGSEECVCAQHHGMVRTEGSHFTYEDGTQYIPFGTTIYALAHQEEDLVEETLESLKNAPFNKVRHCVFPKSYDYNHNEPPCFAFKKDTNGHWDVDHPDYHFWNRFENIICRLGDMGIESDLILFHPYDRWGFANMSPEENETYLRYVIRRFAAMPYVWWSMANEYDICFSKTSEDWARFEQIIKEEDPYGHLLSNHYCMKPYDNSRENITHCSMQNILFYKAPQWIKEYKKPVIYDECCYEGNIHWSWGNISAEEMIHRFWCAYCNGAFASHGETYLSDNDVLWWSKGGKLHGKSPEGIAFLRQVMESIPGALEPWQEPLWILYEPELEDNDQPSGVAESPFMKLKASLTESEQDALDLKDSAYCGHFEEKVFIKYYGIQRPAKSCMILPKNHMYRIELIDTLMKTRSVLVKGVSGTVWFDLPGKEKMAVIAVEENLQSK